MKVVFILMVLIPLVSFSQKVKVYAVEEDYRKNVPSATFDAFENINGVKGDVIVFIKDGNKIDIKCSEIWGFENAGIMYRIDSDNNQPVGLVYKGSLIVWGPGGEMLFHQKYPDGYRGKLNIKNVAYGYISESIYSPIIELRGKLKETKTELGKFRATNSSYDEIFSCPNPMYMWMAEVVAICVRDFDNKKK